MAKGMGVRGEVELRWLLVMLVVCVAALGAGFLVGFLLGS
jgi:hypothetical protein